MAELEQLKGKNWMAAMTLCWLFGPVGGHRFYTGKTGTAWAMLALSIVGLIPITWIWSLVDGVTLAMGNYKHEDGKSSPQEILEAITAINAEGRPIWKPMHMQPIYKNNIFIKESQLDVGADIFNRGLCLPSDNKMTPEQQDIIIDVIHRCFK